MLARFGRELVRVKSHATLSEEDSEKIKHLINILGSAVRSIKELTLTSHADIQVRIQTHNYVIEALEAVAPRIQLIHLRGALDAFKQILQAANGYLKGTYAKVSDYMDLEAKFRARSFIAILFAGVYHQELKSFTPQKVSFEEYEAQLAKGIKMLDELEENVGRLINMEMTPIISDYYKANAEQETHRVEGKEKEKEKEKQPEEKKPAPAGARFRIFDDYSPVNPKPVNPKKEEPELSDSDDDEFEFICKPKGKGK